MRHSFILKLSLLIIAVFILVLTVCGYYIYAHRAAIANKLLDYTIQGMTGVVSSDKKENSTWLENLLNSGSGGVKNTIFEAVAKRGLSGNSSGGQKVPGLATMADMLANGAGNGDIDVNQMALALVNSFGGQKNNENATRQYAPHDVNARDEKGRTLLMNVCRVDVSPKVIKMLLQYGADINAKDNKGRTALMYAAAFNENPEVISLLLERGAKANIRDVKGKKAADYAKDEQIIDMLSE